MVVRLSGKLMAPPSPQVLPLGQRWEGLRVQGALQSSTRKRGGTPNLELF